MDRCLILSTLFRNHNGTGALEHNGFMWALQLADGNYHINKLTSILTIYTIID